MLVFDGGGGGGGGSLVFQQGLDSSQGVRQSRKGVGTIQCRWRSVSYQIFLFWHKETHQSTITKCYHQLIIYLKKCCKFSWNCSFLWCPIYIWGSLRVVLSANVIYLGSSVPAFFGGKNRRGLIRNRREIFVVMRHCRLFVWYNQTYYGRGIDKTGVVHSQMTLHLRIGFRHSYKYLGWGTWWPTR